MEGSVRDSVVELLLHNETVGLNYADQEFWGVDKKETPHPSLTNQTFDPLWGYPWTPQEINDETFGNWDLLKETLILEGASLGVFSGSDLDQSIANETTAFIHCVKINVTYCEF